MSKNLKYIAKNLKRLQKLQSLSESELSTIKTLKKFTSKILNRKKKITVTEIAFISQEVLSLMQKLNSKITAKEIGTLIESLGLLSSLKEIIKIKENNKFDTIFSDLDDDSKDEKDDDTSEEKSLDSDLIKNLENSLKEKIFSQNHAIKSLVSAITINVAGLGDKNKPIGSLLFTGPTGVGKTELAKELAQKLSIAFIRFDMSEYSNESSATKLIGASKGYIGYKEGGHLTNEIIKNKSAVLLLDEIEKAHPNIMPVFLQIMDNAQLTDNHGVKVDFTKVIIIMTSNLGTKIENRVGFGNTKPIISNAIDSYFSPEFINRLDSIVNFNHLKQDVALNIANKFLSEISNELIQKKIELVVDEEAMQKLSVLGYSKAMGARAMSRVIFSKIKKPISQEILFGKVKDGGKIIVSLDINEEFKYTYSFSKTKYDQVRL